MKAGDNPFAPGRLERVLGFDPALAGTSWEALEERWQALGCRAAVTGHRGSGKSAQRRVGHQAPAMIGNERRAAEPPPFAVMGAGADLFGVAHHLPEDERAAHSDAMQGAAAQPCEEEGSRQAERRVGKTGKPVAAQGQDMEHEVHAPCIERTGPAALDLRQSPFDRCVAEPTHGRPSGG